LDRNKWRKTANVTTYATTQFVDKSAAWVKQQTKPFFLWLALNAPHTPFHRPPLILIKNQTLSNTAATINTNQYTYYLAAIEAMDKEIARLIASLTAAQRENTVFVFVGDNGTPSQVAQTTYKANGTKGTLFQGGVNTPLIVCGKNVTRKGVTETALVNAPDMFTTIADIAGAGSEKYQDGITIKPLFTNTNATKRTFVYSELFSVPVDKYDGYTIRNDKYKLISLKTGTEYLYDLSNDAFEKTNLMSGTLSIEAKQNYDNLKTLKTSL
jgi:arylsulfatase B